MSQPLVGEELPQLKVVPLLYHTQHALISWIPKLYNKRKINKRKKASEEGWKNKGRGNSCTKISPSYIHTPPYVGIPYHYYPGAHGI